MWKPGTRRDSPTIGATSCVHAITPDGGRRMPDEDVSVIADRILSSRMQRPDGPAAPLT